MALFTICASPSALSFLTALTALFRKADGTTEKLRADTVVVCQGRRSANALAKELRDSRLTVHVVGDARKPRSYANAIHEAAYLSRQI